MARWYHLAFLAVALCALNGCVYLRLFMVKQQCADFTGNFSFAPGPGMTLVFRHPVLLAEDAVTLIGGPPSQIIVASATAVAATPASASAAAALDADDHWIFRYRRMHPSDPPAPADVVAIDFGIQAGKIERVSFPPQVFDVIPADLAKAMMRAMGHAHVDQSARTATTQVDMAPGLAPAPDRAGIDRLFGPPDKTLHADGLERRIYRYALDAPASATGAANGAKPDGTAAEHPVPPAIIGIVFRDGLPTAQQFQAGVSGLWLFLELPGAAPMPPKPKPRPLESTGGIYGSEYGG